jgi:flagellar assembly protein FliH
MSSSSDLRQVLRGAAARQVRRAPFDVNLEDAGAYRGLDPAATAKAIEAGRSAGFDAGYRDGYAAGIAAAQDELDAMAKQYATTVGQLMSALTEAAAELRTRATIEMAQIEDDVAAAALAVAEAVIGRELALADAPGQDAIARALALAPAGDAIVRLHPDDVATAGGDFGRELTILADPTVEPGGCIVEIGACTIDAQISNALERVRETLQ